MMQEKRWLARFREVVEFIETNHRNPLRHRIEEHDMLNWVKQQRKVMKKGEMMPERVVRFKELLGMMESYKRVNQYV